MVICARERGTYIEGNDAGGVLTPRLPRLVGLISLRKIIDKKIIRDAPPVRELLELIEKETAAIDVQGLTGSANPLLTALLFDRLCAPVTVICPTAREAAAFARDLVLFLG